MVFGIAGEIKCYFHLETFVISVQGPGEGDYATFCPEVNHIRFQIRIGIFVPSLPLPAITARLSIGNTC